MTNILLKELGNKATPEDYIKDLQRGFLHFDEKYFH